MTTSQAQNRAPRTPRAHLAHTCAHSRGQRMDNHAYFWSKAVVPQATRNLSPAHTRAHPPCGQTEKRRRLIRNNRFGDNSKTTLPKWENSEQHRQMLYDYRQDLWGKEDLCGGGSK